MFQTSDKSQLLRRVLWINAELTIFWSLTHKNTQAIYILNRENPHNSEPYNDPRRGLDFIALPAEDVDDDEEVFDHESIIKDANDIRFGGPPVLLLRSKEGRVGCGGVVSGSGLTFFSAISDCCCSRNANCACNCIHLAARLMVWSSSVLSSVQRAELIKFVIKIICNLSGVPSNKRTTEIQTLRSYVGKKVSYRF